MTIDEVNRNEIGGLKTTCNHLARRITALEGELKATKEYAQKLYEDIRRIASNLELLDEITAKRH